MYGGKETGKTNGFGKGGEYPAVCGGGDRHGGCGVARVPVRRRILRSRRVIPLNKSLANSTVFLLGIVLLMGVLSRLFAVFDHFLKYRKELGIMAFFTGAAHVYLSMFPLARHGPWGLYQSKPFPAYAGLMGLVIMAFLFAISFAAAERALGTRLWWKLQYWGARLAFLAIALHTVVLKYHGWGKWFADRNSLPPLSLLAAAFIVFVLAVRLSELFGARAARRITQLSFLAITGFAVWLFL